MTETKKPKGEPENKLVKSTCTAVREQFKEAFEELDDFQQAVFYAGVLQNRIDVQAWVASEVRKFPKAAN
jgi:hypothetical protein